MPLCALLILLGGQTMKQMKYTIKHKISEHRRDKRAGATHPVGKSKYYRELVKVGKGWKDE